jgi:hypothetical protein
MKIKVSAGMYTSPQESCQSSSIVQARSNRDQQIGRDPSHSFDLVFSFKLEDVVAVVLFHMDEKKRFFPKQE